MSNDNDMQLVPADEAVLPSSQHELDENGKNALKEAINYCNELMAPIAECKKSGGPELRAHNVILATLMLRAMGKYRNQYKPLATRFPIFDHYAQELRRHALKKMDTISSKRFVMGGDWKDLAGLFGASVGISFAHVITRHREDYSIGSLLLNAAFGAGGAVAGMLLKEVIADKMKRAEEQQKVPMMENPRFPTRLFCAFDEQVLRRFFEAEDEKEVEQIVNELLDWLKKA